MCTMQLPTRQLCLAIWLVTALGSEEGAVLLQLLQIHTPSMWINTFISAPILSKNLECWAKATTCILLQHFYTEINFVCITRDVCTVSKGGRDVDVMWQGKASSLMAVKTQLYAMYHALPGTTLPMVNAMGTKHPINILLWMCLTSSHQLNGHQCHA